MTRSTGNRVRWGTYWQMKRERTADSCWQHQIQRMYLDGYTLKRGKKRINFCNKIFIFRFGSKYLSYFEAGKIDSLFCIYYFIVTITNIATKNQKVSLVLMPWTVPASLAYSINFFLDFVVYQNLCSNNSIVNYSSRYTFVLNIFRSSL